MNKENKIMAEDFEKSILLGIEGLEKYKESLSEKEILADDLQTFLYNIEHIILENEDFVPLSTKELIKLLGLLSDSKIEKSDNIYNRNLIKKVFLGDEDNHDFIINLFNRKIIREIQPIKENLYKIIFCTTLHVSDCEQYHTNEKLKRMNKAHVISGKKEPKDKVPVNCK